MEACNGSHSVYSANVLPSLFSVYISTWPCVCHYTDFVTKTNHERSLKSHQRQGRTARTFKIMTFLLSEATLIKCNLCYRSKHFTVIRCHFSLTLPGTMFLRYMQHSFPVTKCVSLQMKWRQTWGCAHLHQSHNRRDFIPTLCSPQSSVCLALLYLLQTQLRVKQRVYIHTHTHHITLMEVECFCKLWPVYL